MPNLKKQDLKFKIQDKHNYTVIDLYARGYTSREILDVFLTECAEELQQDIDKYGHTAIRTFLSQQFWRFNPENDAIPKKYRKHLEESRNVHLSRLRQNRFFHPELLLARLNTQAQGIEASIDNITANNKRLTIAEYCKLHTLLLSVYKEAARISEKVREPYKDEIPYQPEVIPDTFDTTELNKTAEAAKTVDRTARHNRNSHRETDTD